MKDYYIITVENMEHVMWSRWGGIQWQNHKKWTTHTEKKEHEWRREKLNQNINLLRQ